MGWAMRLYLKARELGKHLRKGQTMTEYALMLASIAVVATAPTRRWATASIRSLLASIPFRPARIRDVAITLKRFGCWC